MIGGTLDPVLLELPILGIPESKDGNGSLIKDKLFTE